MAESRRDFWNNHIRTWQESECTQIEYCKKNDINKNTFQYWKNRIKKGWKKCNESKLVEVTLRKSPSSNSDIIIILKNGLKIQINSDADIILIKEIISSLEELKC